MTIKQFTSKWFSEAYQAPFKLSGRLLHHIETIAKDDESNEIK